MDNRRIEEFIVKNRELFDMQPLNEGHAERFLSKLENTTGTSGSGSSVPNKKKSRWARIEKLAIIVTAAASVAVFATLFFELPAHKKYVDSDEIQLIAGYYNIQLEEQASMIIALLETTDDATRSDLIPEILSLTNLEAQKDPEYAALSDYQKIVYLYNIYLSYSQSLEYIADHIVSLP